MSITPAIDAGKGRGPGALDPLAETVASQSGYHAMQLILRGFAVIPRHAPGQAMASWPLSKKTAFTIISPLLSLRS
jgi:hypothetical protein